MTSTYTNWGKGCEQSALFRGVDPDGGALPATFYIILIDNTYDFANADPDHDDITDITGAQNPSDYSGNSVSRAQASFTVTIDEVSNDRAELTFATAPQLTAVNQLLNIRGFALCTENNLTTAKVLAILDFGQDYTIAAGQTFTINAGQLQAT